jgi:hypothetical protein
MRARCDPARAVVPVARTHRTANRQRLTTAPDHATGANVLGERDLDARRGSLLVRNGKGGRRREIGMDAWAFEQDQRASRLVLRCRSAASAGLARGGARARS